MFLRIIPFLLIQAVALCALSACAMITTYPSDSASIKTAQQASGSYFLAKHVVRVTVAGAGAATKFGISVVAVQDEPAQLHIGMNLSAFSDDDITVSYEAGLLKQVTAKAADKTGDIFLELAKIPFREGEGLPLSDVTYDFDPFDYDQALETNKILVQMYDRCVTVELEPNLWSPGCFPNSGAAPKRPAKVGFAGVVGIRPRERARRRPDVPYREWGPGIYYRRPTAHRVMVVERGNGPVQLKHYLFANEAPVYRVDIERTSFVTRETKITFKDGAVESIQVTKPSEALAIAKLPLAIINAAIAAPVDGLSKHRDVQKAQADLYDAQAKRIQSEAALTKEIANNPGLRSTAAFEAINRSAGLSRSTQTYSPVELENCINYGRPAEDCVRLAGGRPN